MSNPLSQTMQKYLETKRQYPGVILLFRTGDFYEMFFEDAQITSRILGLTLTTRSKQSEKPIPMAGFQYHCLEGYLKKLINSGQRVAVCDSIEGKHENPTRT